METPQFATVAEVAALTKLVKKLQREVNKISKALPQDESAPKPLSGFNKPLNISSELAAFLGMPKDGMISRTEATGKIIAYIKEKDLQNPENKRELLLDDKLKTIITKENEDDKVTFFNLQRYMKNHYVKAPTAKATKADKVAEPPIEIPKPAVVKKVVKRTKA